MGAPIHLDPPFFAATKGEPGLMGRLVRAQDYLNEMSWVGDSRLQGSVVYHVSVHGLVTPRAASLSRRGGRKRVAEQALNQATDAWGKCCSQHPTGG